jgi:Tol biopolymer transport system component
LTSKAAERDPRFSRDGRRITYVSDETEHPEIYLRAATGSGSRKPISTDGGTWPVWSHRGNEILNNRKLMSATFDLQSGSVVKVSLVEELKTPPVNGIFDVMPDDDHFLMSITPGTY